MRSYPNWLDSELDNWARWSNSGSQGGPVEPVTCASYEKNYVAPPWESGEREERPRAIDTWAAERIERLWRKLPALERDILRVSYPWRHRYYDQAHRARAVGIKQHDYWTVLNRAAWMIEAHLNNKWISA